MLNLPELFEKHEKEFGKFAHVPVKFSSRRDIHAFILLNKLCPNERPMISASEHEKIWLDVDTKRISQNATESHIIDLIRCGVSFSGGLFFMFV